MSAQMVSSLNEIKAWFKTEDLVAALKRNLEAHKVDYDKALKVWKQDVIRSIGDLYASYVSKDVPLDLNVARNFGLTTPVNCETGYNQLIEIFSRITKEEMELDITEANKILNDDWSWAASAKASNSYYSSRA